MDALYLWVKAFHIIAVISWMAGLLYLPRLFVYHSECEVRSDKSETFKVMERRLLKAIMAPAMIVSWALGLILLLVFDALASETEFWFYAKLGLVILLTIFHIYMGKLASRFAQDDNQHGTKFYRLINEVPSVLMVAIVILVIVRPF